MAPPARRAMTLLRMYEWCGSPAAGRVRLPVPATLPQVVPVSGSTTGSCDPASAPDGSAGRAALRPAGRRRGFPHDQGRGGTAAGGELRVCVVELGGQL